VLTAAGNGLDRRVKTTSFLAEEAAFPAMKALQAEAFRVNLPGAPRPSGSCRATH
jgi:enamine deaminase RidA (YjgF/YER057c/UK114 family)